MSAFGQLFGNQLATTRAHLRRVVRVNGDDCPAGPFGLALGQFHQLSPRGVGDALIQAAPIEEIK